MRRFNNTVENYFSKLTIKTIQEGVETGVLENSLTEVEYNWLERKIKGYMQQHYNYNVVKEITSKIPTIATVVAAVLRVSTKATIITAVASTIVELVIRLVIKFFILPDVRKVGETEEEDDLFEDEFEDEDLFMEEVEYLKDEDEAPKLSEELQEAVDTVVDHALAAATGDTDNKDKAEEVAQVDTETPVVVEEENKSLTTEEVLNGGNDE